MFNQKLLSHFIEKSNIIFKRLYKQEKGSKYFSNSFKNACCLDKINIAPKIHKRLFDVR